MASWLREINGESITIQEPEQGTPDKKGSYKLKNIRVRGRKHLKKNCQEVDGLTLGNKPVKGRKHLKKKCQEVDGLTLGNKPVKESYSEKRVSARCGWLARCPVCRTMGSKPMCEHFYYDPRWKQYNLIVCCVCNAMGDHYTKNCPNLEEHRRKLSLSLERKLLALEKSGVEVRREEYASRLRGSYA